MTEIKQWLVWKSEVLQWQETKKNRETKNKTQLDKFFEKAKTEKNNDKKKLTKNMCNLVEIEQQLQTAKDDIDTWMCEIIWEEEIKDRINHLQTKKWELIVEVNSSKVNLWLTEEEIKWLLTIKQIWWESIQQIINAILPDIEEIPFMIMLVTREILIVKRLEKLAKVTEEVKKMLEVLEKSWKIGKIWLEAIKKWWEQFMDWDGTKLKQIIKTLLSPTNPKDRHKVWNFLDDSRKKVDRLKKSDNPHKKIDKWVSNVAEAKLKRQAEMMREIEKVWHGNLFIRDFREKISWFNPT